MQVIKKIVKRESIKSVFIPEEFGDQVEIIILPAGDKTAISSDPDKLMKSEEITGFASKVLASESENVWDEI